METIAVDGTVNDLLKELSVRNISELIKDALVTEILRKISDFSDEVAHFENKYNMEFDTFSRQYEAGEEDFGKYDDLMAWEFAQQGKEHWEIKLEELKSVL